MDFLSTIHQESPRSISVPQLIEDTVDVVVNMNSKKIGPTSVTSLASFYLVIFQILNKLKKIDWELTVTSSQTIGKVIFGLHSSFNPSTVTAYRVIKF